ncbi:unnamed protein product [Paramecium primaurelia]|uniref:Uncharacterized protein n=1 Tax=Paramecium primaurelia TaxID=5886 RepID=A0A8S1NFQ2_PARPR|nr:unnamed protein product [Paramecium primaurelia]
MRLKIWDGYLNSRKINQIQNKEEQTHFGIRIPVGRENQFQIEKYFMKTQQSLPPFSILLTLEGFRLNVIQYRDTYELKIINKDFSHIFNKNNLICQFQVIKQEWLSRMTKMNQKQLFYATFRQQSCFKQQLSKKSRVEY